MPEATNNREGEGSRRRWWFGRRERRLPDHRVILEPDNREELLRGWFVHAHKSRDRHNEVARTLESRRNKVAIPAVALSAISGSGVIASTGAEWPVWIVVGVGLVGLLGAVLAAVNTSLDYAGRAATHHATATRYKAIIRELEQLLTGTFDDKVVDDKAINDLRRRLNDLEQAAPVVGRGEWDDVEAAYDPAYRVGSSLPERDPVSARQHEPQGSGQAAPAMSAPVPATADQ